MPRRSIRAEDLADDTLGIRPEIEDQLMEPVLPEPHPHQGHGEILQEVPRESFRNMISFVLGLVIFSALCLGIISHNLSSKAAMEENQVSNSATVSEENSGQTITKREAPPVSNQEKVENEVNQVTTSKKFEEERAKSTGIEDSSSFNSNQCGIRTEAFSPAIDREKIEQLESKEMNIAPNVKEESESTRPSYQYNPPVSPPRYRYSENSGNFGRVQYGYSYPYWQPYYAPPPIIHYRIPYPTPYIHRLERRHYISQRRCR